MSNRTIALAVDGMEYSLVDRWIESGALPNLERLRRRGAHGTATCSSLSSAKQWVGHFTGVDVDRHGVTGFTRDPGSRRAGDDAPDAAELINLSDVGVQTYPEVLAERGVSVGLLNPLPLWPPLELDAGFCVSGMLTPPYTDRRVEPPELGAELEALDYRIDVRYGNRPYGFVDDAIFEDTSLETLESDLFDVLDARIRAVKHVVQHRETELLYALVKTIDVFQHCFWAHMATDDPEYGDVIRRAYVRVDDLVGWLDAETDANLLVFSDHGFQARAEARSGTIGRVARRVDDLVPVPGVVQSIYERLLKDDVDVALDRPDRTTGDHADPATWFAAGPEVAHAGASSVRFEDMTPTILALLGESIPADYTGEPVSAVTTDPGRVAVDLDVRRRLDIGEDEVVSERLHNLGYAEMVDE